MTNTDDSIKHYTLTMRSKTTFKTHTETIQVHAGQDPEQVAERIAGGYGAEVVSIIPA